MLLYILKNRGLKGILSYVSIYNKLFYFIIIISTAITLSSCSTIGTRLTKVLTAQQFIYPEPEVTSPATILYHRGYENEQVLSYPSETTNIKGHFYTSPPTVTRDGWIEVSPISKRPIEVKLYTRNVSVNESEFVEIKSVTGAIKDVVPNEVRFYNNLDPISEPRKIWLRNLKNPYNGYSIANDALILVEVRDTELKRTWRYLFLYKDFGSRQKLSFNLVIDISSPIRKVLPWVGTGAGNATFTMSYSFGYRFRNQNPLLQWIGDKVSIVGLIGISNSISFGPQIFDYLSFGAGIEYYDFLSISVLKDTRGDRWGIALGFDAVRAAIFTKNLTLKLFNKNEIKN